MTPNQAAELRAPGMGHGFITHLVLQLHMSPVPERAHVPMSVHVIL